MAKKDDATLAYKETINKVEGDFLARNGGSTPTPKKKTKKNKKVAIGEEQVKNATTVLEQYKSKKANFDKRVITNEEWWKLRNWGNIKNNKEKSIEPTSAWLFNSIMNKLADYSDNYPEPNIRARMKDDVAEAKRIKHILPMITESTNYEATYMDTCLSKIKSGTGITGVFWNSKKDDIDIKAIDPLSIYWEPGIKDIQASRNVFLIEVVDNDVLKELYPNIDFKKESTLTTAQYVYEDSINTTDKSVVVDWYYKRNGILHYCKFVNNDVLESTENDPDTYPNGLYDDGEYPFVFDTLFKMEGTITGFGFLDVCKSPQEYIDRLDQAIIINALMRATPRYFTRNDSSINTEEFLDWNNAIVKTNGNLSEDDLRKIETPQLGSEIYNARDGKINELKQTSGNADVNTGSTAQGVTAASAISQLIETGSKGSRLAIKGTYRAYRDIIYKVIERMRQFYTEPRYVRIIGDDGSESFDTYDNSGLVEQINTGMDGSEYYRLPQFDIEVTAQKASPYNKLSQNELALQFYGNGFFAPQNSDASLACVDMMDFDHKEDVINKIKQNGTLYDMLIQTQQQLQAVLQENQQLKVMADLAYPKANLTGMKTLPMPQDNSTGGVGATEEALGRTHNSINSGLGDNSRAEQLRKQAADATEV